MSFYDAIRVGASGAAESFEIERSLRFDSVNSTYLAKTPSTEGNRKTWTLSFWFKRSGLGTLQNLFSTGGSDNTTFFDARFQTNDTLTIGVYTDYVLRTNQNFRDPSAWYHMVIVADTLQATATNRLKLYINGSEVTSFSLDNRASLITINKSLGINSTAAHEIGRHALDSDKYFDGYIAEINLIDGQALTPASFGETDSTTGQWIPIEYEGTYTKSGTQNDGSTFVTGSTASNNLAPANAFNGVPTTSAADAGSMYQTSLNGSYTVTLNHAITVSSSLRIQGYFHNANFNQYSNFFVNGVEQTVAGTPITGTANGSNSGVFEVSFTGTINNFGLQSLPTSITGIAQFIVDGEVLINGFNDNGKNSFYLQFADNSGATATTLGKDTSGQSNNYTPNNFSVSAGKDDDSSFDTPTNNLPTLSSVDRTITSGVIVSNGNLRWQYNYKPASKTVRATMALPATGKIYMEWENEQSSGQAGRMSWGLVRYASQSSTYDYQAYNNVDYINISFGGSTWNGTTHLNPPGSGWPSFTFYTGERAALAIDCSNGKWWLGKVASNGSTTWYANDGGTDGDPAGGTNESATLPNFTTATEWMPFVGWHDGGAASSLTYYANINFGNHSFLGTVPSGFQKLSSKTLDTPAILFPNKHFETVLYTGDGNATRSLSNVTEFQPDWLWTKSRNAGYVHLLYDSVRGAGNSKALNLGGGVSPGTGAEGAAADNATYGFLNSFDASGFSFTKGSATTNYFNQSSIHYVNWIWNAGDTDSATYTVKVVSDSGNKYRFNDFGTSAVTLDLAEGGTYTFDQSDSSMSSHPMQLSTTANGTHGGGSAYSTGVTYQLDGSTVTASAFISGFSSASSRKLIITVAASAPTLYYYCYYHSGMGGAVNTNSTLGSSNFDGTIQTTVKANTTAGFSIVAWTGNGSSGATIGHGLGVTPNFAFAKSRNSATNWPAVNFDLQTGGQLNTSQVFSNGNYNAYYAAQPSSTVLTLGSNGATNGNTNTYVAYVFSEVEGYSKFGQYTGNGDNFGAFIYTGFKVQFLLIKRTTTESWILADTKRNSLTGRESPADAYLLANTNALESTGIEYDMLSNGFKFRTTSQNENGATYIYLAFAESPFKNSRAR